MRTRDLARFTDVMRRISDWVEGCVRIMFEGGKKLASSVAVYHQINTYSQHSPRSTVTVLQGCGEVPRRLETWLPRVPSSSRLEQDH
jgi:hypothetical protein